MCYNLDVEITKLLWERKVVAKIISKHRVSPEEVEEALFQGDPHIRASRGVYHAYSRTQTGRYLFIVLVYLGRGRAQVITAREMTARERRLYRRAKGLS